MLQISRMFSSCKTETVSSFKQFPISPLCHYFSIRMKKMGPQLLYNVFVTFHVRKSKLESFYIRWRDLFPWTVITCLCFSRLLISSSPTHSKIHLQTLSLNLPWPPQLCLYQGDGAEVSAITWSAPPYWEHMSNFQKLFSPSLLPTPCSPKSPANWDTLMSGLTFHTSCQDPPLGLLQFSEVWQLVNKKTRDVNHRPRQFPVGELLSSHQIFSFQSMRRRPRLPQTQIRI